MTKYVHLLDYFTPENYKIKFDIDTTKLVVMGQVIVIGSLSKESEHISLHSKDLEILDVNIDGKKCSFKNGTRDILKISGSGKFSADQHEIKIKYQLSINDEMHGIYPAKFHEDKKDQFIISTQFEANHAREAFPCIDEPAAKATFDMTITTSSEYEIIANTEPLKSSKTGKRQTVSFKTTPIMSTYLLAFVVGKLQKLEAKTADGTIVRTWSTKDHINHTKFSLDTAVKGLDFFADYFGIEYPLEKCDMVGIPNFNSGAMENWGLITYREAALLYDPKNTNLSMKQQVAETVLHELSHQWFGNLVTMSWWTDLWLNEGFASWAANYSEDILFPEFKYWEQFIASDTMNTFSADATLSGRPIEVEIDDPDEIRSIFDIISYSKGPVIVSMLRSYMGAENFRKGISYYLKKHSYNNATTKDLWNDLEEASGLPVASFMNTWTSQQGYPYITAEISDESIKLTQEHFLFNKKTKQDDNIWSIPINSTHTDRVFLLSEKQAEWNTNSKDKLVKLNKEIGSLYLVKYDDVSFKKLLTNLDDNLLSDLDKLSLIHDSFQLSKIGIGKTSDALELISKLGKEVSLTVWGAMGSEIGELRQTMDNEELKNYLKPFVKKLTSKQLKRLGFNENKEDSHFDRLLRPSILGLSAYGKDKKVIDWAQAKFSEAKKSTDIHPDFRGLIFGIAAKYGGRTEYNKLLKFYASANNPHELLSVTSSLLKFEDEDILEESIAMIKSDVKLQDVAYWIAYGLSGKYSKQLMWDWIKDEWNWLFDNFGSDMGTLSWIPPYSSSNFTSEEFLKEYRKFFKDKKTPLLARAINEGEEKLVWRLKWRRDQEKQILKYLKHFD